MKPETLLERVRRFSAEPQKEQVLRELNALLLSTPLYRGKARSYIENAISFIQKH